MTEADTCRTYVLPKLNSADWEDDYITEQMVLTPGRIVPIGDRHTRREGLHLDGLPPIGVLRDQWAKVNAARELQSAAADTAAVPAG
jgi:hypothetical protein